MITKGVVDEDFVNYKLPSMFVCCPSCSFKCDALSGMRVCQNSALASAPEIEIDTEELVIRYLNNPITKAVVFGGLEPFDDGIDDIMRFIDSLRDKHHCNDDVVIYTGYTEDEIRKDRQNYYHILCDYDNVVIKFGRFIPNQDKHYDEVLGVYLSSDNQYAKRLERFTERL